MSPVQENLMSSSQRMYASTCAAPAAAAAANALSNFYSTSSTPLTPSISLQSNEHAFAGGAYSLALLLCLPTQLLACIMRK
jgi:hypothetical protein